MPIPENLTFKEAAGIPEVFLTAFQTIILIGGLQKGKNILIHAGASGVGTAAIQLAKAMEANQIITTSSSRKVQYCKDLGATLPISYESEKEWDKKILEHVPEGVHLILDCIGADYFYKNLNVLSMDSMIVYIAWMSGSVIKNFDLRLLFKKRICLQCSTLRSRSDEYKADLITKFSNFALPKFRSGELKPIIDKEFTLDDIQKAHRYVETNQSVGKVVIKISD